MQHIRKLIRYVYTRWYLVAGIVFGSLIFEFFVIATLSQKYLALRYLTAPLNLKLILTSTGRGEQLMATFDTLSKAQTLTCLGPVVLFCSCTTISFIALLLDNGTTELMRRAGKSPPTATKVSIALIIVGLILAIGLLILSLCFSPTLQYGSS